MGVASIDLNVGTATDARSVVVPVAIRCIISTWQQQHKSNTKTNTLCTRLQNTAAVGSGAASHHLYGGKRSAWEWCRSRLRVRSVNLDILNLHACLAKRLDIGGDPLPHSTAVMMNNPHQTSCEKTHYISFMSFPSVCPEPVLVK